MGWAHYPPETYESPFCIMCREKDRPTLENLSSDLLMSLESLAMEDRTIMLLHTLAPAIQIAYVPVIVTTAELHICSFHPGDVNIDDGKVSPSGKYEKGDFIRFRKGLSTANFNCRQIWRI
jgi:hypothetical protein